MKEKRKKKKKEKKEEAGLGGIGGQCAGVWTESGKGPGTDRGLTVPSCTLLTDYRST